MLTYILFGILAVLPAVNSQATEPIVGTLEGELCGTRKENVRGFISYIADKNNNCWYWQCIGSFLIARRCPLGSAVSDFYSAGSAAPCSVSFNPLLVKFDCTRKVLNDRVPDCVAEFEAQDICKNGGRVVFETDICWCQCPEEFRGDWDCSKRSGTTPLPAPVDDGPCPFGIPTENFCASSPCLNGGSCTNQCLGHVCACVSPFTSGRNCERCLQRGNINNRSGTRCCKIGPSHCSSQQCNCCDPCQTVECTAEVECFNGGTCSRGEGNLNQYATCRCLPGFSGVMCEQIRS